MPERITRRRALATGAAATGLLVGSPASPSQAQVLSDVWGEDFMMQWSPPADLKRDLTPGPTPIRLSCQAYGLRGPEKTSFEDQVRAVREAGYTACEGSGNSWARATITDSQIRELQDVLKQHDVYFYGLHVWVNMIHPDLEQRKRAIETNIRAIEMADRLGLKFILTHTGGCHPKNKDTPHPDNWTKETWELTVKTTKQILKDTSGSKVDIGFEAVNSCNNNTPKSHVRLKQDVGDDRVKVTLDPSNMLHAGTMFRTTELVNECFDLIGEDIVYAHAKDQIWQAMMPSIRGVTLGEGTMDYETFLVRLSRMKYPRALLIEHLKREQYPPSKKYLEDTAARLGVKFYT